LILFTALILLSRYLDKCTVPLPRLWKSHFRNLELFPCRHSGTVSWLR